MRDDRSSTLWDKFVEYWAFIVVGAIIVAVIISFSVIWAGSRTTERCTVTDKAQTVEVSSSGSGEDQTTTSEVVYYIYTEECGALQLRNQLFFGMFEAAELYGSIDSGTTYDFEMVGFRVGWLDWYQTVLSASEVGA